VVAGLVSRPELNGCAAVALVPAPGGDARVPVLAYGPVATERLSLKPANLRPLLPTTSVDRISWQIRLPRPDGRRGRAASARSSSTTLAALIADTPVGDLDVCNEFVDALLAAVRPTHQPPARLFSRAAIRGILRAPGHEVYWFRLDAIAHYFVLEVQRGASGGSSSPACAPG